MTRRVDWQIRVDTGGTFTDGVARDPQGRLHRVKILSTSALRGRIRAAADPRRLVVEQSWHAAPGLVEGFRFRRLDAPADEARVAGFSPRRSTLELDAPLVDAAAGTAFELRSDEEAPLLAARLLTGTASGVPLPAARIRLATTLGTNALLEGRGARIALFTTRGFGDLTRIGSQQRPDLFRLDIRRPDPLYAHVVELDERIDAGGAVLRDLDETSLERVARETVQRGIRVAAVALLNAYADPRHERRAAELLRKTGFTHVSCSHELAPRIKLLTRARTAVVDAYLAPVVGGYLERVAQGVGDRRRLLVATSAGGLLGVDGFRPKDGLLSGPAAGVVGAARAARAAGFERAISFDMGGTSTDVARFDGDFEYRYEHRVGEALLAAPAMAIETVAAGGGSVCSLDGERLRVGPESAGADPGPACYGAGGPLTLTDVNLLLGRFDTARMEIPVQREAARVRLRELGDGLEARTGARPRDEELLEGLRAIADEIMADAIRRISLRRGFDPGEYALVAFGGAGGQHACAIAERLGIEDVVVPADAALLSALGLDAAAVERFVERQVLEPLEQALGGLAERFREMESQAVAEVAAAGGVRNEIEVRRRLLHLRFAGQDATLEVEWTDDLPVADAFRDAYARLFGHAPERRRVELESMRVVASSRSSPTPQAAPVPAAGAPAPAASTRSWVGAEWREIATFERESLAPGVRLPGPALIREPHSTTVVDPGWEAQVASDGALCLVRRSAARNAPERRRPEAVRLELFTQRFRTLVREMGERLERTAVSTNVKERLDFSCALLDPAGRLVVNAPHIPVHLGALGLCVRTVRERIELGPGDVVVTNHPAYGGSHLPDVTVITPVHSPRDPELLLGYVANRAHHAEIGGARPGSMPPAACRLADEGVVIPPRHLVRSGVARWDAMRELLEAPPWPSRAVEDNLADLRAAVAANHAGAAGLAALARAHGDETLLRYMERLQRLAGSRIGDALRRIGDGVYEAAERLDDGSPIRVRVEIEDGRARIDFAGSAGRHPGNLNATPAIVRSAVLYVLRLLLRRPLPLNEGLMRDVEIVIPPGMLDPDFDADPRLAPAVVGGNVETSQRIVDTLLRALGLAACSQGTMNNLLFGGADYGYYETIGGGAGAGDGFHGASGVHTHMTNTRITDPEVLEHRYPVRVERFALRRGSGGAGRFRGGDGLVREIRFLAPASLSVLTQHRVEEPYGLAGGAPGARGSQRVVRADGSVHPLASVDGCDVSPGDRVVVETPGGGGWGREEGETG